ncbi:adenylyl-sulfate kinase [Pelagibacterales bacterium SAG-MED11]|nr:adenylyl-sulfate kinase [Pelagibacterales bacterium SAG-MED11]|tara:strand:- start:26 stop:457 length:432 start_codon:yes stop_codon:yes gene_type:complete
MLKILVMGLPGSGKTTLAKEIKKKIKCHWLNADKVRKKFKDWDFSKKGVLRQARRMRQLANKSRNKIIIADFICPYREGRKIFNPDLIIWMDTIKKGRLSTFDKTFQNPKKFDLKIKTKNLRINMSKVIKFLKKVEEKKYLKM